SYRRQLPGSKLCRKSKESDGPAAPSERCFDLYAHKLDTARPPGCIARGNVWVLAGRLHDAGRGRGYSGRESDARAVQATPNRAGMLFHKTKKWRPVKPAGHHDRVDPRSAGESSSSGCARS